MQHPRVQVYILTYNRPNLVIKSLESVLLQDYNNFEIIVSDNSTNDETMHILSLYSNRSFRYIKRSPSLPWHQHYNTILKEITSDFFVLFHDDDVMHRTMISELVGVITSDYGISAVAPNGYKIKNDKKDGTMIKSGAGFSTISNPSEMAQLYLDNRGCAPFPGYMYRASTVSKVFFNEAKGGKYCDVAFLMDIAKIGRIVLLQKPLMDYYYHESQISASDVFLDKIQLTKYIVNSTDYSMHHHEICEYRMFTLYREIRWRVLYENKRISTKMFLKFIILSFKHSTWFVFPRMVYLYLNSIVKH